MGVTRFCRDEDLTANQEGKVDARYLAEVERMTSRRVRLHEKREKAAARLLEADAAVAAAKAAKVDRATLKKAWDLVKKRRRELAEIERMMQENPGASSSHRGTRSYWPTHAADAVARVGDRSEERVSDGRIHPVKTEKI